MAPEAPLRPLLDDLAMAFDATRFARSVDVVPDPWQAEVLRSDSRRILLNASRQSGKSTTVAILALHEATYWPNSLVLLLSPSLRQSAELFRSVTRRYDAMGQTIPPKAESSLRLELENGSRIISLPASDATIRGYAGVNTLIVDEASRVPDDLYYAVTPMLATTNGRLLGLSTPWGRRGWWADAWLKGGDAWTRWEVPASRCPRISAEFLADQRRAMPAWRFAQEYECQFSDNDQQAFASADVEAALVKGLTQWKL